MTWFDDEVDPESGTAAESGEEPTWVRLSSTVLHATRWFRVCRDSVIRPDGGADAYDHVVAPGAVTVLALDERDRVLLTRQWIYTHGERQWRLIAGGIDPGDEDAAGAARRELAEESGLLATGWEPLGLVHEADSFSNQTVHVYLATGLAAADAEARPDPGEADLELRWVPFDEVLGMVLAGRLPHAGSAHAILMTAARRTLAGVH